MKPARYVVQRMGFYGPECVYGDNLTKVLKKARIHAEDNMNNFLILTIKDGGIVRIRRNGRVY